MQFDLESTIHEPINFFYKYSNFGREYLINEFINYEDNSSYYDPSKKVIIKEWWDEEDNEVGYKVSNNEYTFEEFVRMRFELQEEKSKSLIYECYKLKGESENIWLYKKLMKLFPDIIGLKNKIIDYPECELFTNSVLNIYGFVFTLYKGMLALPLLDNKVRKSLESIPRPTIETSFSLKLNAKERIIPFHQKLVKKFYVDDKTNVSQWFTFFKGYVPEKKINWIAQDGLSSFRYFVNGMKNLDSLKVMPTQPYKDSLKVFLFNGNEIPPRFYQNHNSCKKQTRMELDKIINILKI